MTGTLCDLEVFAIAAVTAMRDGLQILPLGENTLVTLHLRTRLSPVEAIGLELADEVVEDEGVGTLTTIFGQYTDKQEIDGVSLVPLEYLQQMPPAKGQVATIVRLLEGS